MQAMEQADNDPLSSDLNGRTFDAVWADYERDGYVIFPKVLSDEQITKQRTALQPWIDADIRGRNDFEGVLSNRIYAMLGKDRVFADLITHPLQLAFAERELGASCLLSSLLAINLQPGETEQPWHTDDSHCSLPMPRRALGVSTFWAIDPMTEENGATEILPGSHLWDVNKPEWALRDDDFIRRNAGDVAPEARDRGAHPDAIKAIMPAGSLMIAKGTLWHRGGANRTDKARLIVTPQYCPGWMRPLETMLLTVTAEQARALPSRVRELIGYSIHPPFMGYVDGRHPAHRLEHS